MARRKPAAASIASTKSPIQAQAATVPAARAAHSALLAALLFASGASALIYQVIWIKQLALIVGVDIYAITTGISAFFIGLALGGWFLGRWVDRLAKPLIFYAALELGIALLGIAAAQSLAHSAAFFVTLQSHVGLLAWLLPFALIGLPALLMGGTLPALMTAQAPAANRLARTGGRLYAANTLGAVAGALLTTFLLIPQLGVQGTAMAAGSINILLALAALSLGVGLPARVLKPAAPIAEPTHTNSKVRLAIALYAIAGGIALGYEVVWTQTIVQFMSTRSFAFTIVLATYLSGLVIGSALYSRFADRVRDPWGVFATLISLAGLVALLQVAGLGSWLLAWQSDLGAAVLAATNSELIAMCARFALAGVCVVFVPTLLLGAAFPAALRLAADAGHIGRDVGVILALNTAGGIAGTFVTGFVLVPLIGLIHTLAALALAAALIGLIAILRGSNLRTRLRPAVFAITAITAITAVLTPTDNLARLLTEAKGGTLVSYEESPGGTVAVVEQNKGENRFRRLYIQGVSNSGDTMASLRYMRLQALLPLIIHSGEPRSALVIALGTGITAGALTQYPGLEHRVTAELLPAVVRAVPQFQGNYGVATDPHSEIRIHDGRHELLQSAQRYDLITLEPPPPSAAGVVNLYSRDFYELARTRLQPGGIFAQWLPIGTQNDEDSRSLVRSFLDAFPHASLWTTELHEMLLVGSADPMPLDAAQISARFNQPSVATALREVGVATPAALLATWVTDRDGLEQYAADAPATTDDRPIIEYAGWLRHGEFSRVLPRLLELRSELPITNASPTLLAEINQERDTLMTFYNAGLYAYAGDRERWRDAVDRTLQADNNNPYYRRLLVN